MTKPIRIPISNQTLSSHFIVPLGWLTGIEPMSTASQAGVMPLYHNHRDIIFLSTEVKYRRKLKVLIYLTHKA